MEKSDGLFGIEHLGDLPESLGAAVGRDIALDVLDGRLGRLNGALLLLDLIVLIGSEAQRFGHGLG